MALFRVDFCGRGELADRQQKLAQMLSRHGEPLLIIYKCNESASDSWDKSHDNPSVLVRFIPRVNVILSSAQLTRLQINLIFHLSLYLLSHTVLIFQKMKQLLQSPLEGLLMQKSDILKHRQIILSWLHFLQCSYLICQLNINMFDLKSACIFNFDFCLLLFLYMNTESLYITKAYPYITSIEVQRKRVQRGI